MGCEYTLSTFYCLTFMFPCSCCSLFKEEKHRSLRGNATKATVAHYEWGEKKKKSHKRASLIVEILEIRGSFRRSQLPVSLCGGSPPGHAPSVLDGRGIWKGSSHMRFALWLRWMFVFAAAAALSGGGSPSAPTPPGPLPPTRQLKVALFRETIAGSGSRRFPLPTLEGSDWQRSQFRGSPVHLLASDCKRAPVRV